MYLWHFRLPPCDIKWEHRERRKLAMYCWELQMKYVLLAQQEKKIETEVSRCHVAATFPLSLPMQRLSCKVNKEDTPCDHIFLHLPWEVIFHIMITLRRNCQKKPRKIPILLHAMRGKSQEQSLAAEETDRRPHCETNAGRASGFASRFSLCKCHAPAVAKEMQKNSQASSLWRLNPEWVQCSLGSGHIHFAWYEMWHKMRKRLFLQMVGKDSVGCRAFRHWILRDVCFHKSNLQN